MLAEMGVSGQPMGCGSAPARAARRARSFRVCATRDTALRRRKNLEPQAEPIKSDLKYIYCGVCRKMVDIALPKSQELLANRFKFKKRRRRDTAEMSRDRPEVSDARGSPLSGGTTRPSSTARARCRISSRRCAIRSSRRASGSRRSTSRRCASKSEVAGDIGPRGACIAAGERPAASGEPTAPRQVQARVPHRREGVRHGDRQGGHRVHGDTVQRREGGPHRRAGDAVHLQPRGGRVQEEDAEDHVACCRREV